MANRHNVGDLRAAIENTVREIMEESKIGVAPNDEVLSRLKAERKSLISHFTPQLVDIALTKLLNEVCQKRISGVGDGNDSDLFGQFGKIPARVTVERGLKKDTASLTLIEAKKWLEAHSHRVVEDDNEDFRRLIRECDQYSSTGEETIAAIIRIMTKSQADQMRTLATVD